MCFFFCNLVRRNACSGHIATQNIDTKGSTRWVCQCSVKYVTKFSLPTLPIRFRHGHVELCLCTYSARRPRLDGTVAGCGCNQLYLNPNSIHIAFGFRVSKLYAPRGSCNGQAAAFQQIPTASGGSL